MGGLLSCFVQLHARTHVIRNWRTPLLSRSGQAIIQILRINLHHRSRTQNSGESNLPATSTSPSVDLRNNYSEMHLNFAQSHPSHRNRRRSHPRCSGLVQENNDCDLTSVQSLQWVYLGIAIFVFVLAGIFFLYDIPDVPNADMARHAQDFGDVEEKPLKKKLLLWSAVLCQFYYSRSQVLVTGYFVNNAIKVQPDTSNAMGSNFLDAVPGCFAIGRF